jgi:2,3,4,5-tetrahydropyridine-2-carboxylate N-succinyltransferase
VKDLQALQEDIETLAATAEGTALPTRAGDAIESLLAALEAGAVRSASKGDDNAWRANTWVKRGILLGFRYGRLKAYDGELSFVDKDTYPIRRFDVEQNVRVVPGGSSIRRGAYVAPGVVCMPPMYVNVGAYVDTGTMVDSHALIGSCAQIGKRVHLSAAAQIGGVIEPVGAMPVIVEDDVLVGGNTGVYEGAVIKQRAVLAAGVVITGSTPIYDLPKGRIIRAEPNQPVVVPEGAVVVPGSRAVTVGQGREWGLSLSTPVIVKYRDDRTDTRTELEAWIR